MFNFWRMFARLTNWSCCWLSERNKISARNESKNAGKRAKITSPQNENNFRIVLVPEDWCISKDLLCMQRIYSQQKDFFSKARMFYRVIKPSTYSFISYSFFLEYFQGEFKVKRSRLIPDRTDQFCFLPKNLFLFWCYYFEIR